MNDPQKPATYQDVVDIVKSFFEEMHTSLNMMELFVVGMVVENSRAVAEIELLTLDKEDKL